MKAFTGLVVGLSAAAIVPSAAAPVGDCAASASKAGEAFEDQLACSNPPKPGLAIKAMIANGLVGRTKFGADGSPVFAPTGELYVYGKRVTFITGWEMEGDAVKAPFWRGPGTSPPLFLAVTLDATPRDVPYTARANRKPDGSRSCCARACRPPAGGASTRVRHCGAYGGQKHRRRPSPAGKSGTPIW